MQTYLLIDLDDTLISKECPEGALYTKVTTGQMRGESYIRDTNKYLLSKLSTQMEIVPITSRNMESYLHITGLQFKRALVDNGAILLVDGAVDKDWAAATERLTHGKKIPQYLPDNFVARGFSIEPYSQYELRLVKNSPVTSDDVKDLRQVYSDCEVAKSWERSVYITLPVLTKGFAAQRFYRRFGEPYLIAAGDSEVDYSMLQIVPDSYGLTGSHAKRCFSGNNPHDFAAFILFDLCERYGLC